MQWDNPNRLGDAKDALLAILKDKQPLILVTPFFVRTDMRMASCTIGRTVADGQSFTASIELVQIVEVDAESVTIPPELARPAKRDAATPPASGGTQTGTEATTTEDTTVKGDSLLFQAFGS